MFSVGIGAALCTGYRVWVVVEYKQVWLALYDGWEWNVPGIALV